MKKWTKHLALFAVVGVLSVSCNKKEEKKEEKKEVVSVKEESSTQIIAEQTTAQKPADTTSVPAQKPADTTSVPAQKRADLKSVNHNVKKAYAVIDPTEGFDAVGAITFTATPDGVRIIADIGGLKPGKHGFHIHESNDCSAPDASSAGAHFNPTNKNHGGPDSPERHVGDLGNLEANASGFAHYDKIDKVLTLDGPNSIIGRSILIHEDPDDLTTDPSGSSGKRVACGPITIAE